MALKTILGRVASKSTSGKTWHQTIDLVCSMLGITDRHIVIDSARAVVYLSWFQLGKPHTAVVTFNDIVVAVNGPLPNGVVPPPSVDSAVDPKRRKPAASP